MTCSSKVVLRCGLKLAYGDAAIVVREGRLITARTETLQPGEFVAVSYGEWTWPPEGAALPKLAFGKPRCSEKRILVPTRMTEDFALLLGAYASEGHTSVTNWSIIVTNSVPSVLTRVARAWQTELGLFAVIVTPATRCSLVRVASKRAVQLFDALGCGCRASTKRIPAVILNGTRQHALSFLQGLALDAYVIPGNAPKWAICLDSPVLLDELQVLLRRLGYVSSRISKLNKLNGKTYDEVYIAGSEAQRFLREVEFLEPDKAARAAMLLERVVAQSNADLVPIVTGPELYALIPRGRPGRNGRGTSRAKFAFLTDPRTGYVSRRTVERVADSYPGVQLPTDVRRVLDERLHFSPVSAILAAEGGGLGVGNS